jgi:hypothetical protein
MPCCLTRGFLFSDRAFAFPHFLSVWFLETSLEVLASSGLVWQVELRTRPAYKTIVTGTSSVRVKHKGFGLFSSREPVNVAAERSQQPLGQVAL